MDDADTKADANVLFRVSNARQLILISEVLGDELLSRAHAAKDPRAAHLFRLAVVHVVELRGRLKGLLKLELEHLSAAPPVDPQRGAAEPTPDLTLRRGQETSGTTGGAAEVSQCRYAEVSGGERKRCMRTGGHQGDHFISAIGVYNPHCGLCQLDLAHEGGCGLPLAEPSPSELKNRGQPGPKGEAVEDGPAKKGPVTLADHLTILKGGVA